jgi:hypothetical protein
LEGGGWKVEVGRWRLEGGRVGEWASLEGAVGRVNRTIRMTARGNGLGIDLTYITTLRTETFLTDNRSGSEEIKAPLNLSWWWSDGRAGNYF